jgi:Ca-activated chloride channel homolog
MEFARHEYFWLLPVIPLVIVLWGIGAWHRQRMRDRFGDIGNLTAISRISWRGREWLRGLLFVGALSLMALALAYPRAIVRELQALSKPTDLIFLLDTSPSMYARDMDPSRLGRAQRIIERFVYMKQPQDRYGLVAFSWTSVILSYMTTDPQTILLYFDYLNQQNVPQAGTNVGAVLANALQLVAAEQKMDPENSKNRRVVFVLLSDGDDTADEYDNPLADVIRSGIKTYTIGLGTANGAYVPQEMAGGLNGKVLEYYRKADGVRLVSEAQVRTMIEISDKTGGRFVRGERDDQVNQLVDEILLSGRPVAGFESKAVPKDFYMHFLIAAFVCLLAAVFL